MDYTVTAMSVSGAVLGIKVAVAADGLSSIGIRITSLLAPLPMPCWCMDHWWHVGICLTGFVRLRKSECVQLNALKAVGTSQVCIGIVVVMHGRGLLA